MMATTLATAAVTTVNSLFQRTTELDTELRYAMKLLEQYKRDYIGKQVIETLPSGKEWRAVVVGIDYDLSVYNPVAHCEGHFCYWIAYLDANGLQYGEPAWVGYEVLRLAKEAE